MISLLMRKALSWATVVLDKGVESVTSNEQFVSLFCRVFNHTTEGKEVGDRLISSNQGCCEVMEYALELRTLAAKSRWNKPSLRTVFHQS